MRADVQAGGDFHAPRDVVGDVVAERRTDVIASGGDPEGGVLTASAVAEMRAGRRPGGDRRHWRRDRHPTAAEISTDVSVGSDDTDFVGQYMASKPE